MQKMFSLNILTPEASVYKGEVSSLVVPAPLGLLGVLADHAPIITNLKPGKIIIKEASGRKTVVNSRKEGFLEVLANKALILLDCAD